MFVCVRLCLCACKLTVRTDKPAGCTLYTLYTLYIVHIVHIVHIVQCCAHTASFKNGTVNNDRK